MSVVGVGTVAALYTGTVIGLHRINVRRLRAQAGGFPTLDRLDWSALIHGLLPPSPATPSGVGDLSAELRAAPSPGAEGRHRVLTTLVSGLPVDPARFEAEGFSGGESQWLTTLSLIHSAPDAALERLFATPLGTSGEVYLREHLFIRRRLNLLNLELGVFAVKRRLSFALGRFGEAPALYFARAQASARLGFNAAVLDDLARAVYFSRNAPFYLRLITELPWAAEARPSLFQQCTELLAERSRLE